MGTEAANTNVFVIARARNSGTLQIVVLDAHVVTTRVGRVVGSRGSARRQRTPTLAASQLVASKCCSSCCLLRWLTKTLHSFTLNANSWTMVRWRTNWFT